MTNCMKVVLIQIVVQEEFGVQPMLMQMVNMKKDHHKGDIAVK